MTAASNPPLSPLVALPDAALWTSRTWTDFQRIPPRERARQLVLLPLFGFADWGLGRPLDLEETLGCAVLREALAVESPARMPPIVLPPLRFVLGPYPHTLFGIDLETALELVREVAASVKAAGFRRLVLFNTSPWNEALIDIAGFDLRVESGLQTFCVNLAGLGLDLHPVRSKHRAAAQCAACACYGTPPAGAPGREDIALADFRPSNIRQPAPLPFDRPLDDARAEGVTLLANAGRQLAAILAEARLRKALPRGGRVGLKR